MTISVKIVRLPKDHFTPKSSSLAILVLSPFRINAQFAITRSIVRVQTPLQIGALALKKGYTCCISKTIAPVINPRYLTVQVEPVSLSVEHCRIFNALFVQFSHSVGSLISTRLDWASTRMIMISDIKLDVQQCVPSILFKSSVRIDNWHY